MLLGATRAACRRQAYTGWHFSHANQIAHTAWRGASQGSASPRSTHSAARLASPDETCTDETGWEPPTPSSADFPDASLSSLAKTRTRSESIIDAQEHPVPEELMFLLQDNLSHGGHMDPQRHTRILAHLQSAESVRGIAKTLAASRHPARAQWLLEFAHRIGTPLREGVYDGVAFSLATLGRWDYIPPLLALAKRQMGHLTGQLLDWRTRADIERGDFTTLGSVLSEYQAEGQIPSRRTWHLLVSGHLRNHDVGEARHHLQLMRDAGFPPDTTTYALVVKAYRELGPDEAVASRAFAALEGAVGADATRTLNALVQFFFDGGHVDDALHLLSIFEQRFFDAAESFSALSSPLHQGDEQRVSVANTVTSSNTRPPLLPAVTDLGAAGSIVSRLIASNAVAPSSIPVDVATFTILLNHMSRVPEVPRIARILNMVKTCRLVPDSGFVAAAIRAYFAIDDASSAIAIIARLCRDSARYSRFRKMGGSIQPSRLPFRLPETMQADVYIFNAFAAGILRTRGLDGFLDVLRIMETCALRPNAGTLHILLSYLARTEGALSNTFVEVLRKLQEAGVRITMKHYNAILTCIVQEERLSVRPRGWDVMASRFSSARRDTSVRRRPSIAEADTSFHPTGGFVFASDLRQKIQPILDSLVDLGARADRVTIALRIKHDGVVKGDMDSARGLFDSMVAAGMHPTRSHYHALMEGYTAARRMEEAEEVLRTAEEGGFIPNRFTFTILITGYARDGRPGKALQAFQRMITTSLAPDVAAVDALCSAYFAVGHYRLGRQLLLQLWPHIKALPPEVLHLPLKQLKAAFRASKAGRQMDDDLRPPRTWLSQDEQIELAAKLRRIVKEWARFESTQQETLRGLWHASRENLASVETS